MSIPAWAWPAIVVISATLSILFIKFGDGLLNCGFTGDIDDVTAMSKSQSRRISGSDRR